MCAPRIAERRQAGVTTSSKGPHPSYGRSILTGTTLSNNFYCWYPAGILQHKMVGPAKLGLIGAARHKLQACQNGTKHCGVATLCCTHGSDLRTRNPILHASPLKCMTVPRGGSLWCAHTTQNARGLGLSTIPKRLQLRA